MSDVGGHSSPPGPPQEGTVRGQDFKDFKDFRDFGDFGRAKLPPAYDPCACSALPLLSSGPAASRSAHVAGTDAARILP